MHPLFVAAALIATPDFPAAIGRDLSLQTVPRCSICHATDAGGAGTVVQPFGVYLRSRGLRPFDESSLRNALLADAGEGHSSNTAGISDIDALKAGQDPNAPAAAGAADLTPAFGCSHAGSQDLLTFLALAACLLAWRRHPANPDGPHPQP